MSDGSMNREAKCVCYAGTIFLEHVVADKPIFPSLHPRRAFEGGVEGTREHDPASNNIIVPHSKGNSR